jgi:surface protein
MFAFFGLSQYFGQGSSAFFPCALMTMNVNGPSFVATVFVATVFYQAPAFNGNLNQWDVAKVTDMSQSKSIRILESDLT